VKISFPDGSYVSVEKTDDKVVLTVAARDYDNPRKKITNAVELSLAEIKQLMEGLI
jgi:hypothetical protein